MPFLPGYLEEATDAFGWSQAQRISLITFTYVDVAFYCALLVFALSNIWLFVIKK